MRKLIPALLIVFVGARAALGDTAKILIPLAVTGDLPGAYGSIWRTESKILNRGSSPLVVTYSAACVTGTCTLPLVLPGSTATISPWTPVGHGLGVFATVDRSRLSDVVGDTRVFDTSRESTFRGADVPFVPESAAETGAIEFASAVTAAPFRARLRVYDFDPAADHSVRVRVYRPSDRGDVLVKERIVSFEPQALNDGTIDTTYFPGYAEVDLASMAPGEAALRVETVPSASGLRYWAMVSITNDTTQYLTVLLPAPHEFPDQTAIAGASVWLSEVFVWRDFMPSVGGNSGLRVVINLDSNRSPFPAGMKADLAWIESSYGSWQPMLTATTPVATGPTFIASGGPEWPTGSTVDVVVRVKAADGSKALLRAHNVAIVRTD